VLRELSSIELGGRIRKARLWAGVSGRQLSEALGAYPALISNLETGRKEDAGSELLKRIANHLAGRGRLEGFEPEQVMDYLQGRIDLDDSIRVSPVSSFRAAPGVTGLIIEASQMSPDGHRVAA
jgi:transcriptional regulator with XRE-family HTH domain